MIIIVIPVSQNRGENMYTLPVTTLPKKKFLKIQFRAAPALPLFECTYAESTRETTCQIKGLPVTEANNLENHYKALNIYSGKVKNCLEIDTEGISILNVLGSHGYNYRVESQSMAIDTTAIGGSMVKTQKTIWTLTKVE
ncbi:unnamed protein product [Leptosia nina]|uniref:Uncharacterized protein n=1 Tax=Leptosia nina TaxID=320188 RepID=A0AAV1K6E8_9NEOP